MITSEVQTMNNKVIAAARVTTIALSSLAFATIIGSGIASADPQDCAIQRDAFGASVTCHDTAAPPGREYVLTIDCWGLHGIPDRFPFYAVGPYTSGTSWFVPTGQASGNCSTSFGALVPNIGVVTGAHVDIYRQ